MLTVKLIHKDFDRSIEETFIFEASQPYYRYESVDGYDAWLNIHAKETNSYGIPSRLFMDIKGDEEPGISFVIFNYTDEYGCMQILFVRRSVIFIMQDGKTIDKISC